MRNKIMAAIAAVAALLTVGFGVAPAQAAGQTSQSATVAIPPDANGYKFWSPSICVDGSGINGAYYRVAYIAQQWNIRAQGALSLDYSDDCVADGYPPSRRMVIGSYSNASDASCVTTTNVETEGYHGFMRWTNGPGSYINFAKPSCISSQTRRDHVVSEAIGILLGLRGLNSTGYNSRVMNGTNWSWDNVPLPDVNSGDTVFNIYSNVYCLPEGTTC